MSKKSCIIIPEVSIHNRMEPSRLFKDLVDEDKQFRYSRKQAVYLYVFYITKYEKEMEAAKNQDGKPKYIKNRQGQFNAKDVVEFADFNKYSEEINNLGEEAYRAGATDKKGKSIDYTDAEEVLNKIDEFNDSHKGLLASIEEHPSSTGAIYNMKVFARDAGNIGVVETTKEKLKVWEVYKQVFNSVGVDLKSMPTELNSIFSANNMSLDLYLKDLKSLKFNNISRKEALALFYLDADSKYVNRLKTNFGSIEDAALALEDMNKGNIYITTSQKHLLEMAFNHAKEIHNIDLDALKSQIDRLQSTIRNTSLELSLKNEIHKLNKKYNLDRIDIKDLGTKLKNLSDVNIAAITNIKRRITAIKKEKGNTTEGRELTQLYNKLKQDLNGRQSFHGLIDYLKQARTDIASIDTLLDSIPENGEIKNRIFIRSEVYKKIKDIKNQYQDILAKLATDSIDMNESISKENMETLRQQAVELDNYLRRKDREINELIEGIVKDCLREVSGGNISESEIKDVLEKGIKNVGWLDQLAYAMADSNNLILATSGSIVREAQDKRNAELAGFVGKIDRITHKLYKSGITNTEFMYEDQMHIISDIDWGKYEEAKRKKERTLKDRGIRDFDLIMAMDEWEEENTVKKIVDKDSGRTERVPNKNYRKVWDFQQGWTEAQKEYYRTVMEYKGKLESMYPTHAQNYYLPPQVRRNMIDAWTHSGITNDIGKGLKNIGISIGKKVADIYTVREDDTNYVENGIVEGEGDYDNSIKKEIPIYYQKAVEKGELMLDFSAAMLRHASSAFNYNAMNDIKDTVETIKDYVNSKVPIPKNPTEETIVDNILIKVTRDLFKWGKKNNVSEVLSGFIDQHVYGIKRNPGENKRLVKFVDSLISYTSFRGLATNFPGAVANEFGGFCQIFIDTVGGEFFNIMDIMKAVYRLHGKKGMIGDLTEWLSNDISSKTGLLKREFDPEQEEYENIKSKRYHSSVLRKILSKDLRFIGYGQGEYLIHLIPLYAILEHQKVLLNGKKISLYEAYEVTEKEDGNRSLKIKDGVTDLDGNPITDRYIAKIRGIVRKANQSMHGAMNEEEKGLAHQYMLGRLALNFKQWMIAHYSRRFRRRHFDTTLKEWREGYYTTFFKGLMDDNAKDAWEAKQKLEAAKIIGKDLSVLLFGKDLMSFFSISATQWDNFSDMQKYNIRRARAEVLLLLTLVGLSMALGEPEDHKKEYWRRFSIYQIKRMITETEAAMPLPEAVNSAITIFQSPMAGVNTFNSLLYALYGIRDISEEIKSGPHKGENKYLRNLIKYDLPFFKDIERMQTLDEDDSLFKVFDYSPSNH